MRFTLPPGYGWGETGRIEVDPDERVADTVRLLFRKFRELGRARQVVLWARQSELKVAGPATQPRQLQDPVAGAAYHTVLQVLQNPIYAGAYAFGRTSNRTKVVDGRARKTSGHRRPMPSWSVLLRGNHEGYITWSSSKRTSE